MHDALTGHSGGGVGRSNGGGFGLKALAEAMERIEVPEAVKGSGVEFRSVGETLTRGLLADDV